MKVEESNSNMRFLITSAAIGALVAGLGFYLMKRYRKKCLAHDHNDALEKLKCKLEKLKKAAFEAQLELKESVTDTIETMEDNISNQLEAWTQNLKDTLMTQDMQDAVGTIQFVLDKLMTFDMEAKSYENFTFVLLALVRKAQHDQEKLTHQITNQREDIDLSSSQFERAKRFGQYAINMYPTSWKGDLDSIAERMGISADSILKVWFNDDEDEGHCPKFLLFLDHEVKSLVLAIRGTFSIKDAILDAVCDEVSFLDGFAHKGILVGAQRIISKVREQIWLGLTEHSGYKLVITGHSLGAGTAELITLDLMLGRSSTLLPQGTEVSCVALAAPPVYRSKTVLPANVTNAIEIYINNFDCVPRLSLGSIARLLACMRAVDSLGLTLAEQLSILAERSSENVQKNTSKLVEAVKHARQDKFPVLEHPGIIFHARKAAGEETNQIMYKSCSQEFTGALLLLDDMVLDHLHTSYEVTLQNVKIP